MADRFPTRNRIKELLDGRGWSYQDLADAMPVEVTKQHLANLAAGKRQLTERWMGLIAGALALDDPSQLLRQARPAGARETEASYTAPPAGASDPGAVKDVLYPGKPHAFWMRVETGSMNLAGLLPGTFIVVDPDRPPRAGDLVVVQHYGAGGTTAETLIRQVVGTHLVSRAADPGYAPLARDEPNIRIAGTIVRSYTHLTEKS